MNIKEAAVKFNLSESTIYEYLKLGLFQHAKKNKQGHWVIASESLKPYRIPSHQGETVEQLLVHILRALNLNESISITHFGLSMNKVKALFLLLEKEELVMHSNQAEDDLFKEYMITMKGIEFLNTSSKMKILENILKKININININFNK